MRKHFFSYYEAMELKDSVQYPRAEMALDAYNLCVNLDGERNGGIGPCPIFRAMQEEEISPHASKVTIWFSYPEVCGGGIAMPPYYHTGYKESDEFPIVFEVTDQGDIHLFFNEHHSFAYSAFNGDGSLHLMATVNDWNEEWNEIHQIREFSQRWKQRFQNLHQSAQQEEEMER